MSAPSSRNIKSSHELLFAEDRNRETVVKSLLLKQEKSQKLKTFKVPRSHLFDEINTFLPVMKASTADLLGKNKEERDDLDIENTEGCEKVVQMDLLLGKMNMSSSDSDEESNESEESDLMKNVSKKSSPKKTLVSEIERHPH